MTLSYHFRNTVIIMTSNLGSEFLLEGATVEGEIKRFWTD